MSREPKPQETELSASKARLDKWLWQARFFKSRGLAQALCRSGLLRVNGTSITKPDAHVGAGDILSFPYGRSVRVVQVIALPTRRGPPAEARLLYRDLTEQPEP
ncbi:RNA-binding S4 domain-containing protein [Govanella unica]|uniref:RNA-binding S4 domain-containing protein n=1 Tax=Govanella unica TaxID=2975056 RepID=A0A9X3TW61_9PROT|nr:RNA-binding S4 domain-containing protein [Govania unica]MDA5192547.1 RNA-binding S4 domain-containing protein [Govania unica]